MRNYIKASAVILAISASPAFAQDNEGKGVYIGAAVGVAGVSDPGVEYYDIGGAFGGSGTEDTANGEFDLKSATQISGAIGYDFGSVRSDVEISYSRNKIKSLAINEINGTAANLYAGDRAEVCEYLELMTCAGSDNVFEDPGFKLRQLSAMANVWLDLPIGGAFTPYAGAGLGVAGFEADGEGKAKFAWQLGAGGAFEISRNFFVTADYRHREVGKTTVEWDEGSGFRLGKLKTDSLTAGVRFVF